ncbi:MAG TPA: serine/threonine-protein kinase, partial [Verrucomicrobiae bacterium]|nr:serine/threonine-protein kinase [Verrucomicrobiae bacterium]
MYRGPAAGEQVGGGRYTLRRALGRGGMGVVWLAFDERLKEQAALKFLPPEIRLDPTALDDLRRETTQSRKLTHAHIVRIHDLYEAPNEAPFISMEYVDGPTLTHARMDRPTHVLEWDTLAPLIRQLCEALEYAHGEQIVHRDLKPANVMMDRRNRVKLADFGIARVLTDTMSRVTQNQRSSGTLVYMSPQQLDGKESRPIDDIYSLGATIYELLTSRPPFYTGDVPHQIRYSAATSITQRLAALGICNPIPPEVEEVITACLEKEPAKRPQSAREFAERLKLVDPRTPPSKRTQPATEKIPAKAPAPRPRDKTVPAILVASVLIVAGLWYGTHFLRESSKGLFSTNSPPVERTNPPPKRPPDEFVSKSSPPTVGAVPNTALLATTQPKAPDEIAYAPPPQKPFEPL